VVFPRGTTHLAYLDRALGPGGWNARAPSDAGRAPRALYVYPPSPCPSVRHRLLVHVGQAHLQHYTEPSAEPLPATSTALQATILPLGPGTFTHNAAGVPVVVVCTKADLIEDTNDLVGAGSSGMGGMVKGKGDEWEERTDAIMQILRTVCLKCACPIDLCNSFIFIYLAHYRWRRPFLHNTATSNTQCLTPVRAAHPFHTSRSNSRRRC
jgi:hypothetical protein